MNFIRWKLDTYVQFLVLQFILKDNSIQPEKISIFKDIFKLDVKSEKIEKEKTSPKFLQFEDFEIPETIFPRSTKYADGGVKTKFESTQERPTAIDSLASRYGGSARQVRYSRGRRFTLLDPDGDFLDTKETANVVANGLFEKLREQRMGVDSNDSFIRNLQIVDGTRSGESGPQ